MRFSISRVAVSCLAVAALGLFVGLAMAVAPPEVETKDEPQTQLYIRTIPPDAKVQVSGQPLGNSPMLIAIPPAVGKVVIEVELDGFQSQKHQIVVQGGRITRVELKLDEAKRAEDSLPEESSRFEADHQSGAPPSQVVQDDPGKLGRLDLRMVPTGQNDSKVRLSKSEIQAYEKQLQQEGPFVGRDRGDDFGWFQLRCQNSPDLITAEHEGRRFVLLSNRPAEIMLAIGWRTGPWKLHEVVATEDDRGLPSITIEMDQAGGQRMNELTTGYQGSRLAMLVDDQAISMPLIRAPIGRRILITGSFTRDEVDRLIRTLRASVVPPRSSQSTGLRERHFVRLVVGKDRMTFEGQETTWEKLPESLQAIPNRSTTVLEVAIASDQMSVRSRNQAQSRAIHMAHRHGFEYPSDIGVHPLGSKGTPPQKVADPRSQTRRTPQSALADFVKNLATGSSRSQFESQEIALQHAAMQIQLLSQALKMYQLDMVGYPSAEHGLEALLSLPSRLPDEAKWRGPYVKGPLPLDPWNRPFRYRSPGVHHPESFDIWSLGPDRVDGTDDDIGNWQSDPPRSSSPGRSIR